MIAHSLQNLLFIFSLDKSLVFSFGLSRGKSRDKGKYRGGSKGRDWNIAGLEVETGEVSGAWQEQGEWQEQGKHQGQS